MTASYTDITSLKLLFPSNEFGTKYDPLFDYVIEAESRKIDMHFRRKPGAFKVEVDTTRYLNGNGKTELWFRGLNSELAAVPTTVACAESGQVDTMAGSGGTYTTWAATDYYLEPENALEDGLPFLKILVNVQTGLKSYFPPYPRSVKITGRWGFSTSVPSEIQQATQILAVRFFKRAQQAFADAGAINEFVKMQYVREIDPDVVAVLKADKFATSWI